MSNILSDGQIIQEAEPESKAPNSLRRHSIGIDALRPNNLPNYLESENRVMPDNKSEEQRLLFQQVLKHLSLFNIKPFEKNNLGEYIVSAKTMEVCLAHELDSLRRSDSLINLILTLRDLTPKEKANTLVGTYKLSSPSIKELNEKYLLYHGTNDLIAKIFDIISGFLSVNEGEVVGQDFKGGKFIISKEFLPIFEETLKVINGRSTEALIALLSQRINYLISYQSSPSSSRSNTPKTADNELNKAIQDIEALREKLSQDQVKISFGLTNLTADPWVSLHQSEIAANLAISEGKESEYTHLYNEQKLSRYIVDQIYHFHEVLGADSCPPSWANFITYATSGIPQFLELGLGLVRKTDDFLSRLNYEQLPTHEQKELLQKLDLLKKYYKTVNVLDILKKFTLKTYPAFQEKITKLIDLIDRSNEALKEKDDTAIRTLFLEVESALRLSLKGDQTDIRKTSKAFFEAAYQSRKKLLVFMDHIDFGLRNTNAYIDEIDGLINLFKELKEAEKSQITEQIDSIRNEIQNRILSVGDNSTSYLRSVEELLHETFNGSIVLDCSGGDEVNAVIFYENDLEEAALEETLSNIASKHHLRIAYGAYAGCEKEINSSILLPMTENIRREIVYLLNIVQAANSAQNAMKANEKGLTIKGKATRIELSPKK